MQRLTRREFLKLSAVGAGALTLSAAGCSIFGGLTGKRLESTAQLPAPFTVPVPIPPVLEPAQSDAGTDYYEITQREARVEILPGLTTTIWGYNGIFPGPTIEARSGRKIVVKHRNELPVPTVTHLHGGVTPPESDGYPTDFVLPAGGFDHSLLHPEMSGQVSEGEKEYFYPMQQRAATLWYHDHRMDFTGPQVYRGLAGFLIIRDEGEESLPLPKGEKDIPLMIADRSFAADGELLYPSSDPSLLGEPGVEGGYIEGVLGDVILVNGAPWPYLEVAATRYRFRFLNASNARRYELELDPRPDGVSEPLIQIGSDGGLLAEPVRHGRLPISPAERYDLVIDFGQYPVGSVITLKNRVGEGVDEIMQFRVTHTEPDQRATPARLSEIELLDPNSATEERRFRFHRDSVDGRRIWVVNGEPFDTDRIWAAPKLGTTEIWELRGNTNHPFHVHLVNFQVISRDGGAPAKRDAGWKDTVNLDQGQQVKVIARFDPYPGKYVFHCHILEHEDMMMMANFEVTD